MNRKVIAGVVVGLVVVGVAFAQFDKPEKAIKYRKSVMFLIAQHFGRMGAVVKGDSPYQKEGFAKDAELVATFSTLPWEAFMAPATDKGDTTMSAAVLKQPDQFKAAVRSFESDTGKLSELAQRGDFDGAKAQFGAVAKNCKSCHTTYRVK